MTVFQFVLLIFGVGSFTWAHPDLVTVLFLVVLSRLLWKWGKRKGNLREKLRNC